MTATAYRWDQAQAAVDYDAAAPHIHPCYKAVQDALLAALPFATDAEVNLIDLGGGSGRLAERLVERLPNARVTIVDPSEAFLRLARQRLSAFADRVHCVKAKAQDPWLGDALRDALGGPADAIVSTSALHHLEGAEKNAVFRLCHGLLGASRPGEGGVFVNGDEYRPPSDTAYRALLEEWGEHMDSSLATGAIPETFGEVIAKWRRRNLEDFGGPRQSGDDCLETVEEQTARLYGAGFRRVETAWRDRLWGVISATV